ncbi:MAG: hypothetical protein ACYS0K_00965 [Planctomycetota bacterium]|jgi:hypothetical protein
MKPREALLVFLLVAAAFAAAFALRVATRLHDPRHADAFAAACDAQPLLGAVRVRTGDPHAAQRLTTAPGDAFSRVLAPARAESVFRYGRLLYATPAEVDEALARLKRGEVPKLPPQPDIARYYRDARGPYACDVILRDGAGVESIEAALPDADLSGEPVVREAEARHAAEVPHALIFALAVVCVAAVWRPGAQEMQWRLLAALAGVVGLGLSGWGLDVATLPALVCVAATPRGGPLLAGVACLFFPSLALRRIGTVFVVGGLVRWVAPRPEAGLRRGRYAAVLVVLAVGGWWALGTVPVARTVPEPLRGEPAVVLVPRAEAPAKAAALRREGLSGVVGAETPVPPRPDLVIRRKLTEIFRLSMAWARKSSGERRAQFEEVAEAAALESLYLPLELRARLHARDGRAVIWIQDELPLDREEFMSALLYRQRGDIQMRNEARFAALAVLLLGGAWLGYRRGHRGTLGLLAAFLGLAAGVALLFLAEPRALTLPAELLAPVLVVAALAPSAHAPLGLAAAAVWMPQAYLGPAVAFALASGGGWLGRVGRRSGRSGEVSRR